MSSIIDAYELEYDQHIRELSSFISTMKSQDSFNKVCEEKVKQFDSIVKDVNDLIKQIEMDARSVDLANKKMMADKVNLFKKTLNSKKQEIERVKEEKKRSSLLGEKSIEHRNRMLNTNEKINRQNEVIRNAERTVYETEELGVEITNELLKNREKIQGVRAKTVQFNSMTDSARRLVTSMSQRDTQQKYIIWFIAALLCTSVILLIYFNTGGRH